MKRSGFTLIELMVAMVIGLAAVTSIYALGSAMSKQFFIEQRVAVSQGTARVATLELRQDISRAGLFGSPNASLVEGGGIQRIDPTCDVNPPELPKLAGAPGPMGAFQYYSGQDTALLNPGANPDAVADRLRVLTSLYLTEQLLVNSTDVLGTTIVLQTGNQAFRRTFGWGTTAGPFLAGTAQPYLSGTLDWQGAFAGANNWNGIGMRGARAFEAGSVLHIETPEGRHFFRPVFGKGPNIQNQVRVVLEASAPLPIGTACLPGAAGGSTVTPLQWVEYAVVDPLVAEQGGADPFMEFAFIYPADISGGGGPATDVQLQDEGALLEGPNRVLVRRILNAANGNVIPNSTQIIAEFVTHFEVSFVIDVRSGSTTAGLAPLLEYRSGSGDQSAINDNPERVRSVIIDLGIRNPLEDPNLDAAQGVAGVPTRFDVNTAARGAARVRHLRIEVPVMSIARRNLG